MLQGTLDSKKLSGLGGAGTLFQKRVPLGRFIVDGVDGSERCEKCYVVCKEGMCEVCVAIYGRLDVNSIMHQLAEEGRRCKYTHWKWFNPTTGEIAKFNCNSWDCRDCRGKQVSKFARRVASAGGNWLVTITNLPGDKKACRLRWQHFIRALRTGYGTRDSSWTRLREAMEQVCKRAGKHVGASGWRAFRSMAMRGAQFEYARVLERGGRTGMRHYHLIIRGEWVAWLLMVGLAHLFGFGYVGDVREVYDEDGVGWYLGKYLGKSGGESGWNKVSFSRRYLQKVAADVDGDFVLSRPDRYGPGDMDLERRSFRGALTKAKEYGSIGVEEV